MTDTLRPAKATAVLPVVLTATFMQLLDVTILQVALPSLTRDLRAGPGAAQLTLAGYTLTYACLLVTAGRLGDRYGYRRLFVVGMATFTLASVACAVAPTAPVLVAARLVQGAGSGLMAPQVLSIIQTAVPSSRRPHALGLLGATMGVASLTGPVLGGLLIAADVFGLGWRLVFLINVPVGLAALVGAALLPATRGTGAKRVDVTGAVLVTAGLAALVFPLSVGPDLGWPAWALLCLAAAPVLLCAFTMSQARAREPLLHPSVFADRTARSGLLLVFAFNAGVPSFSYVLFLHLQSSAGYPALAAALVAAPYAAAAIVGSRVSPLLVARWGPRLLTVAAVVLAAVMATLTWTGVWLPALLPLLAVGGFSFGLFTASVFALVLARAGTAATGSASGLLPTAQQLGGTIGVTLAGLLYVASGFGIALVYETAAFLVAATITLVIRRPYFRPVRDVHVNT